MPSKYTKILARKMHGKYIPTNERRRRAMLAHWAKVKPRSKRRRAEVQLAALGIRVTERRRMMAEQRIERARIEAEAERIAYEGTRGLPAYLRDD